MSIGFYTLSDDGAPICICAGLNDRPGLLAWARWMEKAERAGSLQLNWTQVGSADVSTVFLGVALGRYKRKPLVFETLITTEDGEGHVVGRCGSVKEALAMHDNAVLTLRARGKLQEGRA